MGGGKQRRQTAGSTEIRCLATSIGVIIACRLCLVMLVSLPVDVDEFPTLAKHTHKKGSRLCFKPSPSGYY